MADVVLQGGEVLARRFRALQREARLLTLAAATVAGAQPIRDEAKRLAPQDSGEGAEGIVLQQGKVSATRASVDIGYDKEQAWHMLFQELGTAHHAAQPHLRPALDTKKDAAVGAVGRVLRLGIDAARRA